MKNLILLIFSVSTLISCATYSPKPIIDGEIDKALNKPEMESINHLFPALLATPVSSPIDFKQPLTIEELATITIITNPDLKALRAKNKVAGAQVFDAGLLPDPQLLPLYEIPLSSGSGVTPAFALALNWDIGSLFTRNLKESAAINSKNQIHYDVAWQEWMIANQAELLATRIYFLEAQNKLIQNEVESAKSYLTIAKRSYASHDLKADEFSQQQNTYLDLVNQLQAANRLSDKTKLELNQIIGLPPSAKVELTLKPNQVIPTLDESALFTYARHHRLDILALEAGYNNQEVQVHQAILGQYPHFNVGVYPGQDNTSNQYLGTTVSFDIPVINRNRGTIAIAKATREQLYQEYIARLHNIQSNIAVISKEISWATNQESTLNLEMPALLNIDIQMKYELNKSNINLATYMNEHSNVFNKQLKLLAMKQDIAEQRIAMQMVLGKYLGN